MKKNIIIILLSVCLISLLFRPDVNDNEEKISDLYIESQIDILYMVAIRNSVSVDDVTAIIKFAIQGQFNTGLIDYDKKKIADVVFDYTVLSKFTD